MPPITPASAEDLSGLLKDAAARSRSIAITGNNSKRLMAGPIPETDLTVSTARLNKVLQYEPHDLTIGVEAGMRWADLQELLARNRQMVALDPPFWPTSTVGGVIASNASGSLRKAYGTARDLVIGLQFAMLDGDLVRTGGMVVKNVAGLDMGKLLIGSFGTLAVLTSVNFRLHALPPLFRTFLFSFADLKAALGKRDTLLASPLRPVAVDLLSPAAAARLGFSGYLLAIRAAGSERVLARYARELPGHTALSHSDEQSLWAHIREFTPDFLARQPGGVILRVSTPLTALEKLLRLVSGVFISRALSGVSYIYLSSWDSVPPFWKCAAENGWPLVVEFAPPQIRSASKLWLLPTSNQPSSNKPASSHDNAFDIMKAVKEMFDPGYLLNRGRLYGRI